MRYSSRNCRTAASISLFNSTAVVRFGARGGVLQIFDKFGPAAALAQPGAAAVDGDAQNPGPQRRLWSQRRRLRKTRRNTSWATSSASCRCRSSRTHRPKTSAWNCSTSLRMAAGIPTETSANQ